MKTIRAGRGELWWKEGEKFKYGPQELGTILRRLEKRLKHAGEKGSYNHRLWQEAIRSVQSLIGLQKFEGRHQGQVQKLAQKSIWVIKTSNPFREAVRLSQDNLEWGGAK